MSKQVFWIVEGNIRPEAHGALVLLIDEMVANTRADEPGTMTYEWFVDPGKEKCHIFERYQDSAAAMIHLHTFDQKFARRLGQVLEIRRITLYGDSSEELRKALSGDGTVYLYPVGGFTR